MIDILMTINKEFNPDDNVVFTVLKSRDKECEITRSCSFHKDDLPTFYIGDDKHDE